MLILLAFPTANRFSTLLLDMTTHLSWWQWVALPLLAITALGAGMLFSRIFHALLVRLASRTTADWDDALVARLPRPMGAFPSMAIFYLGLPAIALEVQPEAIVLRILRTLFILSIFWMIAQGLDVLSDTAIKSPWTQSHPAARALVPVGRRILKVMIWVIAILSLLSDFGFPVGSIMAGLGIGGLAFALAGQKTAEHLFGAVAIGLDQPLSVGDFVRIEEFVGTVESIGVRSTRIRTLDRTVITIPNGKLAEMRIETFAARDRIRLLTTIGVVYDTSPKQMREILENLEQTLRAHPLIWPENVIVRFKRFGESSLDIEVMAWFLCDWDQFLLVRQEILLQFMEVVEQAGSSFAFPSRTLYVAGQPSASVL